MKVIQIIDNLRIGGAEKQFAQSIAHMATGGLELYLFFPCCAPGFRLPEELANAAHDCVCLRKSSKFDLASLIWQLKRFIRAKNPDIVHSWLYYSNLLNVCAKGRGHKKIISQRFDYRTCIAARGYPFAKRLAIGIMDRSADKLVVNTRANLGFLKDHSPVSSKVCCIPNCISVDEEFIKKDYRLKDDQVRIMHVGSFKPEKNHAFFLGLLQALRSTYRISLSLFGDGALKKGFARELAEAGLDGSVRFEGEVRDAYKQMSRFDIFVYPSVSEGMANALMEAMACGLPCVSSDAGGNAELIKDDENGLLFKAQDAGKGFSCVSRLIESEDLRRRLGAKAAETMRNDFSVEKTVSAYCSLYGGLIK